MADRTRPQVDDLTAPFWQGGADAELRIQRCAACRRWTHPPLPMCPACHATDLRFERVSGTGTVWSYTINRYRWSEDLEPPYVLAEVELPEQEGLRLLTSVVDCDDVEIGMPVHVRFEPAADTWIPVFAP